MHRELIKLYDLAADRCRLRMDSLHPLRRVLAIVSPAFSHQVSPGSARCLWFIRLAADNDYLPVFHQVDQPLGLNGLA